MTPEERERIHQEADQYWAKEYPHTVNSLDAEVSEPNAGLPDDDPLWLEWQAACSPESNEGDNNEND